MKWKDLSAEERYRVLELAQQGVELSKLSEQFGVSRQALYRAMEKVKQASLEALEPKKRGRKPKGQEEKEIEELAEQKHELQQELEHMKTKYEVAQAYIELMNMAQRGEPLPGEEGYRKQKKRSRKQKTTKKPSRAGKKKWMGIRDPERSDGSEPSSDEEMDKQADTQEE